jgi:hypothetical protein
MNYKKLCYVVHGTYCEVHDEPLSSSTMMACMHEAIAVGLTGHLQSSVKFFCLNMGLFLKRHSFAPMPMPDRVICHVNTIRACKKQGRNFCFLNGLCEPCKWTDKVSKDDPKFQGLLDEEEAPYPDLSTELPGPELESDGIDNAPAITQDDTQAFKELVAHTINNAGINPQDHL